MSPADGDIDRRLRRRERIRRRPDFLSLYQTGKKVYCRYLVAYVRGNEFGWPRLGVTVSKKVGPPVVRNRVKRSLREIFRRHKAQLLGSPDLVLNARRSAARASYQELEEDFLGILRCWNEWTA